MGLHNVDMVSRAILNITVYEFPIVLEELMTDRPATLRKFDSGKF